MKKKNNKARTALNEKKRTSAQDSRLIRRKSMLARKKEEDIKDSDAVFRRRVKEFPQQNSPKPLRTKGFYRFAKDFPSEVDADGFRTNRPPEKKQTVGRIFLTFLLCTSIFCFSFICVTVCIKISERPGENDYLAQLSEEQENTVRALRFTYSDLKESTPEEIVRQLQKRDCNAAVFELKDENGYVPFPTETVRGSSAAKTVESAWDTVAALEQANVRTVAYISCFRDSAALSDNTSLAVKNFDDPSVALTDNKDSMWLDPYMPENTEYIKALISEAVSNGFSYILLDNICFPYDLGLKTAYYSSVDIADNGDNSILLDFIAEALGLTGENQLIIMCDAYGFADSDVQNKRYGGPLYTCGAELFAADARLSRQTSDIPDPLGAFTYLNEIPSVFILDVFSSAGEALRSLESTKNARVFACIEDDEKAEEILSHSRLKDYIIW